MRFAGRAGSASARLSRVESSRAEFTFRHDLPRDVKALRFFRCNVADFLIARLLLLLVSFTLATRAQPYIAEFMAAGNNLLVDEDGDHPDWIEIHNPATNSVNLNGWFLTDNA